MSLRRALVLCLILILPVAADDASSLYKQGRKAQKKGDFVDAYLKFTQAMALDPHSDRYRAYALAVQRRATEDLTIALPDAPDHDGEKMAETPLPAITADDEREARKLLPPPELKGNAGRLDFDLTGDTRQLYEKVLESFGLMVVFDSDFQPGSPVRFSVTGMDWRDSIRALESVTGTFVVPVNEKMALVAKDTPQKRTEIEPYMSVLVPFDEPLTQQEVQEAARAVQTTFDIAKVGIDNARKLVLLRDRVSRLRPALEVFRQLLSHKAQVMVDVEVLSVAETSALGYGLRLPTSFPIAWLSNWGNNVPTLVSGLNYLTFGGGATMFGIGIAASELFANMTRSSTTSVTKTVLRGLDSQPMAVHLGDRYPVITQGYFGATPSNGTVYTPPPTVQFEDLGVVIKLTPRIHSADEVSIDVEAELKMLAGQALNGIPVISNRKIASRIRMRFDQTAVLAGLIAGNKTRGSTGLPLPPPFRAYTFNDDSSQLLVTIRPYLVSPPPTEVATRPVRVGSESRPLTPLD